MRGHANGHGVLAAGHDVVNVRPTLHHDGERPGPELLRELRRNLGHFSDPAVEKPRRIEMHDDGMGPRTPLGLENLRDRRRILRIRAEAVDGFSGESHELTVAQGLHGSFDLDLRCTDDADHCGGF